jgi:hypothetical protein
MGPRSANYIARSRSLAEDVPGPLRERLSVSLANEDNCLQLIDEIASGNPLRRRRASAVGWQEKRRNFPSSNWRYAVCDGAMRKHVTPHRRSLGNFPYPGCAWRHKIVHLDPLPAEPPSTTVCFRVIRPAGEALQPRSWAPGYGLWILAKVLVAAAAAHDVSYLGRKARACGS